jgi:hypothetical protein
MSTHNTDATLNLNDQILPCHSERSEESVVSQGRILRFAQNDMPMNDMPMMDVKSHYYIDQTCEGKFDDNV